MLALRQGECGVLRTVCSAECSPRLAPSARQQIKHKLYSFLIHVHKPLALLDEVSKQLNRTLHWGTGGVKRRSKPVLRSTWRLRPDWIILVEDVFTDVNNSACCSQNKISAQQTFCMTEYEFWIDKIPQIPFILLPGQISRCLSQTIRTYIYSLQRSNLLRVKLRFHCSGQWLLQR